MRRTGFARLSIFAAWTFAVMGLEITASLMRRSEFYKRPRFKDLRRIFREEWSELKWMLVEQVLMLGSFVFWLLDVTRILCDAFNHVFQGHGVWHLGTALTILAMAKHYSKSA
jgi:hypothetical protein